MKPGKPLARKTPLKGDPAKAMDWQRRSTAKAQEAARERTRAALRAPKAPPGQPLPRGRAGREKRQIAPERKIEHPRPVERVKRPVGARKADWNDVAGLKCVICGSKLVVGHHTVYEQEVRRRDESRRWDVTNRTPLCGAHHMRHHDGSAWTVPLAKLPDDAIAFAFDLMGAFAGHYLHAKYSGEDPRVARAFADAEAERVR